MFCGVNRPLTGRGALRWLLLLSTYLFYCETLPLLLSLYPTFHSWKNILREYLHTITAINANKVHKCGTELRVQNYASSQIPVPLLIQYYKLNLVLGLSKSSVKCVWPLTNSTNTYLTIIASFILSTFKWGDFYTLCVAIYSLLYDIFYRNVISGNQIYMFIQLLNRFYLILLCFAVCQQLVVVTLL